MEYQKFAQVYGLEFEGKIVYVGVTTMDIRQRISKHYQCSAYNRRGAKKLGEWLKTKPKFLIKILEYCPSEIKFEREKFWIKNYNTINNGLNSENFVDAPGRQKGCSNPTGKDHYLYGKKVDPKIWRESVKKRQKPVKCIETGKVYKNQITASKAIKCSPSRFKEFFDGKIGNIKGFTFKRINHAIK